MSETADALKHALRLVALGRFLIETYDPDGEWVFSDPRDLEFEIAQAIDRIEEHEENDD